MQDEAFIQRLVIAALAVYRVADLFPAGEPMATELRKAALRTTASFTTLFYNSASERYRLALKSDIETIIGYFYIARGQNWIDRRNFDVLIAEYRRIEEDAKLGLSGSPSKTEGSVPMKKLRKGKKTDYISSHEVTLSVRQQKIVAFIQGRDESNIGVLAKAFPNITKRTILRDLETLIQSNVLVRDGTTKHSVYRIGTIL